MLPFGASENWSSLLQAVAVGAAGGLGAILFRYLIDAMRWLSFEGSGKLLRPLLGDTYVIALPAIGVVIVSYVVRRWAPEAQGHGVPEVQFAVRKRRGIIRPRVAVIKALASALCIGTGGSVGREGPIVQIGCSIGSSLGQVLGLNARRVRLLVACGAAAGIGGTFNAPIGGVMFAMEVILGNFAARSFGLVVIASVTSTAICRGVLGNEPAFDLTRVFQLHSFAELPMYAVLGLASGLIALLFVRALYTFESVFERWTLPASLKALIGGLAVGLVGWACMRNFGGPYLFGVGYDGIERALRIEGGAHLDWALGTHMTVSVLLVLVVLKIFATSMTLAAGGSGGVFAPGLFIGAMSGGLFGLLVNAWFPGITAPPGAYALVGMAAIFAGSAHAPITAILILFEMTDDYQIMLPLMIAVVLAHLVASALDPDSIYSIKLRRLGGLTPNKSAPSVLDLVLVADATSTDYLTVKPTMPLTELARRLHEKRRGCAVVVDDDERMAGIVTVRDVEASLVDGGGLETVEEVMTRTILTCTPDQRLRDVADTIRDQDLGQIPVVDKDDPTKLIGMLRRRELLWAYGELASEHDLLLEQANPEAIPESRRERDAVLLDVELSAKHEKLCFKKIRDLSVPNEFRVAFVRRGGRTMVPLGNTVVEPGDVLVMLSTLEDESRMRQWVEQMTAVEG